MDFFFNHAPTAERNPLATRISIILRENLRKRGVEKVLRRMYGTVCVVSDDLDVAVTMRFDYGRVTVHDDVVGVPDITLRGDSRTLTALRELPPSRGIFRGLLNPATSERNSLRMTLSAWRSGDLKVYGLLQHPRLVRNLFRVLARAA